MTMRRWARSRLISASWFPRRSRRLVSKNYLAGGDLPELLREQAPVDQEPPARLGSHRSDA